jgi:DNA polymerase elongation subunit (family B)
MIKDIRSEDVLFLDIESVPQFPSYSEMPERLKHFWDKKATFFVKENETPESIFSRSGIYAEFGKIICISAGFIVNRDGSRFFRVKSFYGDNEKDILKGFSIMLNRFSAKPKANICAHNGKEFDFPYISRRMLVNGIELPEMLDVAGKKPWEVKFLDTMELWKFGDYKNYTSLDLLANIFGIQSPKDDIDGSQVADVYYIEKDIERIVKYCEKDALTVAQLFLSYKNESIIDKERIERVLE